LHLKWNDRFAIFLDDDLYFVDGDLCRFLLESALARFARDLAPPATRADSPSRRKYSHAAARNNRNSVSQMNPPDKISFVGRSLRVARIIAC
jgi:hypothetical protein